MNIFFALAVVVLPLSVGAQVPWSFDFTGKKLFPAKEPTELSFNVGLKPGVTFTRTPVGYKQRSFGIGGHAAWSFPNKTLKGSNLDPAKALLMEATLSIQRIDGEAGAFFQAMDGKHRYSVFFSKAGLLCIGEKDNPTVKIDHSVPHTYTLVSPPSSNRAELYIDGKLRLEYAAKPHAINHAFNWGDGRTAAGHGADAMWLHVRIEQKPTMKELDLKHEKIVRPKPEELKRLVDQLGSETFREREAATKALRELGHIRFQLLRPFVGHEDPEVRLRIGSLLGR